MTEMKTFYCTECKNPCVVINGGIGGYEFLGHRGHQHISVSDCCEAAVITEEDKEGGDDCNEQEIL